MTGLEIFLTCTVVALVGVIGVGLSFLRSLATCAFYPFR